jgi:hypothetical protein
VLQLHLEQDERVARDEGRQRGEERVRQARVGGAQTALGEAVLVAHRGPVGDVERLGLQLR